jgi:hypothetical protein
MAVYEMIIAGWTLKDALRLLITSFKGWLDDVLSKLRVGRLGVVNMVGWTW